MQSNLTHSSAAFRICVNNIECGRISGQVFSQRLLAPVSFTDLSELLLQVEEVLNKQNFPQAFQRTRSFGPAQGNQSTIPAAVEPGAGMCAEAVEAAQGTVATFTVCVLSRHSATWQGQVGWLDDGETQSFSSVLGLIKLADKKLFGDSSC